LPTNTTEPTATMTMTATATLPLAEPPPAEQQKPEEPVQGTKTPSEEPSGEGD
jgi:hypothetical protein